METTIMGYIIGLKDNIGIMEQKMETTLVCYTEAPVPPHDFRPTPLL